MLASSVLFVLGAGVSPSPSPSFDGSDIWGDSSTRPGDVFSGAQVQAGIFQPALAFAQDAWGTFIFWSLVVLGAGFVVGVVIAIAGFFSRQGSIWRGVQISVACLVGVLLFSGLSKTAAAMINAVASGAGS